MLIFQVCFYWYGGRCIWLSRAYSNLCMYYFPIGLKTVMKAFTQNNMLQVDSEVSLDLRVISGEEAIPFSSAISYLMELSISLGFNSFQ